MTAALADTVTEVLISAVAEGELAAGLASDLARRIVHRAILAGVDHDDMLELSALASRT